jgi:hypothetical protein
MNRILERILVSVTVLVVFLAFSHVLQSHEHKHPELNAWYLSLRNSKGTICCNMVDCHRTEAEMRQDGKWWARLGRAIYDPHHPTVPSDWELTDWVQIPDDVVLKNVSNPTGEAVICHSLDGTVLFCFVEPNLS